MTDQKQPKILVVEDDDDLRESIICDLEISSFKVYAAKSGSEAIRVVNETAIDLVLSDIQMPSGNGIELLEKIRKFNSEVPIVVLMTGYSTVTTEEAMAKGAFRVLTKPFTRQNLLGTLKEAYSE